MQQGIKTWHQDISRWSTELCIDVLLRQAQAELSQSLDYLPKRHSCGCQEVEGPRIAPRIAREEPQGSHHCAYHRFQELAKDNGCVGSVGEVTLWSGW